MTRFLADNLGKMFEAACLAYLTIVAALFTAVILMLAAIAAIIGAVFHSILVGVITFIILVAGFFWLLTRNPAPEPTPIS